MGIFDFKPIRDTGIPQKRHDEFDLAWAAGLIDGEGCIHLGRSLTKTYKWSYSLRLSVKMTSFPTIDRLLELFEFGWFDCQSGKGHGCKSATASWNGAFAQEVLWLIRPYMVTKAEEADWALLYPTKLDQDNPEASSQLRSEIFFKLALLKPANQTRGRRWAAENQLKWEEIQKTPPVHLDEEGNPLPE